MYHSIGKPASNDSLQLRLDSTCFRKQVYYLLERGWKVKSVLEILTSKLAEEKVAAFSFDDGYENQIQAADILERFGAKGTFFVIPGLLSGRMPEKGPWKKWRLMSKGQICALFEKGHEIGAHSFTHLGPLQRLPKKTMEQEIYQCQEKLTSILGQRIKGFSYPHGGFSPNVLREVENAGFVYACTSRPEAVLSDSNPFVIPRIEVRGQDSCKKFLQKIDGHGEKWRLLRYYGSRFMRELIHRYFSKI